MHTPPTPSPSTTEAWPKSPTAGDERYLPLVYGKAKVAWQEHRPTGELLGPPPQEGAHPEYKSTFRARADSGELFKPLQTVTLKTVAAFLAFLNSREGGTLLIGVADDGSVFGLGSDYATLRKPGKDGRDLFGLHLSQALSNAVGMAATANVSQQILEVGGKDVCRVHVKPSGFPIEAEVVEVENGQYVKKKLFYGRFGNAPRPINRPVASPKVIHPSAWKGCSANFAFRGFYKVVPSGLHTYRLTPSILEEL